MSDDRALATIRRISAIDPIPNADAIVCLTIDGWKLVSQIGNFNVGDLCVYFEIDSFLPVREEFEFLRDRCYKSTKNLGDGFRLRTIKLRGQISQGLALPIKDIPEAKDQPEGTDLTEILKVQKYEKPIPAESRAHLGGKVRGNFPSFLQKTDQERVQNCLQGVKNWVFGSPPRDIPPEVLEKIPEERRAIALAGFVVPEDEKENRDRFEVTIKFDGTSMTVYHYNCQYGVCSRNLDLTRDDKNVMWQVALEAGLVDKLVKCGQNIALQGELMGPGIQDNREKLEERIFFLFDIYDIDRHTYFTPLERLEWCLNNKYTPHIPILSDFTLEPETTVEHLLTLADNTPSLKHAIAEGIVFKSYRSGGPSFKVISNKFLLTEKD